MCIRWAGTTQPARKSLWSRIRSVRLALCTFFGLALIALSPATRLGAEQPWPVLLREDFQMGAQRWQPFDPTVWRIESDGENFYYSQYRKDTSYKPPHRSPLLISLLQQPVVTDFDLRVRVKSTHPDYGHRDCCIVFGYQDAAHFYYVHLGKQTDDHANQIFVVDGAPRVKISTQTSAGTPWDEKWHWVRVVRHTQDGSITVYFDDMDQPVMKAIDRRFLHGRIGVGSFDDTSAWDDIELRGIEYSP